MSVRCCVAGCDNTSEKYPSKGTFYAGRFIRFPEHPDKRKIWNKIIGSDTIVIKFICLEHFSDDVWSNQDIILNVPLAKRKLKPDAVPSRNLPTKTLGAGVMKVAEVKEQMDEQTRKRLVADALAEYDMIHSDTSSRSRALLRRRRCPSIDEQTRKRLVAEALAAYETNNSDGNDISSSNVKSPTRKKHRNKKSKVAHAEEAEAKEEVDEQPHNCIIDETLAEYHILYSDSNDNDSSDIKPTEEKDCCGNIGIQEFSKDETPVDEMEIAVKECNFFANQTRKCGEVILDVDGQTFALNCSFCPGIFLNFLNFSNHVLTQHARLLEEYNSNPLDDNSADTKKINDDLACSYIESSAGVLQEAVLIDTILVDDELQKNCLSDNNKEQHNLTSIEILPRVQNENNEIDLNNQALIMQVICFLKQSQFHIIWDETHSAYECYKKRRVAITELITLLLEHFPKLPFTIDNMQSLLTKLRHAYIREVKRKLEANQNNIPHISNLWCFNELKYFGKEFKTIKRVSLQHSQSLKKTQKIAKQKPLFQLNITEQNAIEIIEEYKNHPTLWNIKHPSYRGKFKDCESLSQLQLTIQTKNPQLLLTEQTLVELLKHMHSWYIAEQTLQQQSIQLNQDFESKFPRYFALLDFLSGNVSPFRCKSCKNIFNSEYNYLRHIRDTKTKCGILNIDTINECQYCRKRFETAKRLKVHIRTHTGERPYTCEKCGKKFFTRDNLFGHKITHNKKRFQCDICERFYYTASILRRHKNTHLGIRDKVCEICGKSFANAQNLYRHQHLHRETPKFECKLCGKRFKQFSSMFVHRKRCTNHVNSSKRKNQNKEKATKKLNKNAAELKRDIAEQKCFKEQSLNESKTLVEFEKVSLEDCENEPDCKVDVIEQEPLYIYEDTYVYKMLDK